MERATRILNAFTVVTLMVTAIYVVLTFSAVLSPAVETTLAGGSIVYGVIHFRRCEWLVVKRLATALTERNPNRE
jgi:presenilin-like A22 family membrane protease